MIFMKENRYQYVMHSSRCIGPSLPVFLFSCVLGPQREDQHSVGEDVYELLEGVQVSEGGGCEVGDQVLAEQVEYYGDN